MFLNNNDGRTQSVEVAPTWDVSLKSNASAQAKTVYSFESLSDTFYLSDQAYILQGNYHFYSLSGFYQTPSIKMVNTRISLETGSFYDGQRVSVGVVPSWTLSRFFGLSGFIQWNKVKFSSRQQEYKAIISRLKASVSLNVKLSADAFIQYNSDANLISTNFRFRYNPREGTDLFLVVNQGNNTNRYRLDQELPIMSGRTILVKYTYTFVR